MFRKPMKMRNLEVWGVPSYIVDIWEKNYSRYLLPVQEKAVREYGVLDFEGGNTRLLRRDAPRNDNRNDKNNLLVVAPTSSGKTFIGEMAAITQAVHKKKIIYLVPLRSLAEEKYHHFKDLYANCDINTLISSRDRREYDKKIIKGDYQVSVMVYEKFNYFLLKYPNFLREVSLIVIDEMQMIHDPIRGPLLEEIIAYLKKNKPELKIIGLSAFLDNEVGFLNWISADSLLSYKRPVELRKGLVREGTFKYVTHNNNYLGEEIFFAPDEVRDNCYEDYLEKTVSYFVKKDEPTLLFFPTRKETRRWAGWLAEQIDAPRAENAIFELSRLEETRSRDELLYLLEKGIAYHNGDLSWEERNLVETYLKKGEIKLICATTTLAMGVNLPFKNVILTTEKFFSSDGNYRNGYFTSMSMVDVENMGGRAGRLNQKEKKDFGRVIFLAHSLLSETVVQNVYFKALKPYNPTEISRVNDSEGNYHSFLKSDTKVLYRPLKREKNFTNFLLKAIVKGINTKEKLDNHFKELTSDFKKDNHYWAFNFEKNDLKAEIKWDLKRLLKYKLIACSDKKDGKKLSPTKVGISTNSRGIDLDTYIFFKEYLKNKKGKLTNLELITLLTKSSAGKNIFIPFSQFNHVANRYTNDDWIYCYQDKMTELVLDRGEDSKEIYQDILELNEENPDLNTEDYLSIKKALLLYDWIGDKEIREVEEEYKIYSGAIRKLGEGFSWLADSLTAIAESLDWNKKKNKKGELAGIKILSERLAWGVEEEGLGLARLHIPGLGRSYMRALLREGYDDRKCLEELSEKELAKVVPKRLAERIKKRLNAETGKVKERGLQDNSLIGEGTESREDTEGRHKVSPYMQDDSHNLPAVSRNLQPETRNPKPVTILEIDTHRPDRIIFEGKKVKVTAKEFSLIYLLALHNEQVMSYDELLEELWKDEEDAIYNRVSFHISKIRRTILKTIGKRKINEEKVKDIFVVVPKRGVILKLKTEEIKIK